MPMSSFAKSQARTMTKRKRKTTAKKKMTMRTKATAIPNSEPGQSKATPELSCIQFPISIQRSPLGFLLVQQQVQRDTDGIRALPELLRQVPLADDYVARRITLMNAVPIPEDFVGQKSQVAFLLSLGTFCPRAVGLQN